MSITRKIKLLTLMGLCLTVAAPSFAGDANTDAAGRIDALDANQGAGTQVNADDWSEISNVLAGSGTQAVDTEGDANTGSGSQNNSYASQDYWEAMENANSGSGAQVIDSSNSNGGDRTSNDIVMTLGSHAAVASSALESSISGNAVTVTGEGAGSAGSSLAITDGSGFFNLAGVNAIALSSGHNSSQNISVNVTASVGAAAGDTNIGN